MQKVQRVSSCWKMIGHYTAINVWMTQTTIASWKNVETLRGKKRPFLLQIAAVRYKLTSLLPSVQSCSSKFWAWSCIVSKFDKGWRRNHKLNGQAILFISQLKPKYGTVSQVLNICNWLISSFWLFSSQLQITHSSFLGALSLSDFSLKNFTTSNVDLLP